MKDPWKLNKKLIFVGKNKSHMFLLILLWLNVKLETKQKQQE
jgi:hypothetical protein